MTDDRSGSSDKIISPDRLEQSSPRTKVAAISELAAALREDLKGWEVKRGAWAKERTRLDARGSYSQRQIAGLKQEIKRLGRVAADVRHESQRLALERAALRGENDLLVARNRTLEARNIEMRYDNETIAKRNRKLLSLMKRELAGGGDSNVCRACRKELTNWVDSIDGTKAPHPEISSASVVANTIALASRMADAEDSVPRRNTGQRCCGDSGDEDDVATPGRRNLGGNRSPLQAICGGGAAAKGVHAVEGGLRDDAVESDERSEKTAQREDRGKTPLKPETGGPSGVDSRAQRRDATKTVTGGVGIVSTRPVSVEREEAGSNHAAAARVELDQRAADRSNGNDLVARVILETSAQAANLAHPKQRMLPATSSFSASGQTKFHAHSGKKRPRLSLGEKDEQRHPEIVEMGTTGGESRRAGGRALGGAPWRQSVSAPWRRSEVEVVAMVRAGEPRRRAISGGSDPLGGDRGGEKEGNGKEKREQRRKRTFRPEARRDCEPPRLLPGRRTTEGHDGDGSSNDPPAGGQGDGDGRAAFTAWGMEEGGEWREGIGDSSSETLEGAYPPLAMAAVYSPQKKKGSSSSRRRRHEVDASGQQKQEPARPLLKSSWGQLQNFLVADATVTMTEERTKKGVGASSGGATEGGSGEASGVGRRRDEARRSPLDAASPEGIRDGGDGPGPDGGEGTIRPPLPNAEAIAMIGADDTSTKEDSRYRKDAVEKHNIGGRILPGARVERKRADARSAVETEGDEGRGDGSREKRTPAAAEELGTVALVTTAAEKRSFVSNPYQGGGGGAGVGEVEEGERSREGGGPNVPPLSRQQQYKFQEVVRGREKRAAMKGHDCQECAAYVTAVGCSPGERDALLNMCSRHKHTEANGLPPETPEGFWDLSFADSISSAREKELILQRRQQQQQLQRWRNPSVGGDPEKDDDDSSLGF